MFNLKKIPDVGDIFNLLHVQNKMKLNYVFSILLQKKSEAVFLFQGLSSNCNGGGGNHEQLKEWFLGHEFPLSVKTGVVIRNTQNISPAHQGRGHRLFNSQTFGVSISFEKCITQPRQNIVPIYSPWSHQLFLY